MEETINTSQNNSKNIAIIVVILIIVIAAGYFFVHKNKNQQSTSSVATQNGSQSPSPTVSKVNPSASSSATASSSVYKDGTYTVQGTYETHASTNHIKVQVTLKNDVITDATVTSEAQDPLSVHFQGDFISGYKPIVIGKKIQDVHLTKVSGSSLTPIGFDDALQTIESQAKS